MPPTDPRAYLRATPPFDRLPEPLFVEAANALDVVFEPAGTWLARPGGRRLEHLWVIRKGSVRLARDGQTLQVLEEGETFGYTSLITRQATLDVQVEDDLVAYRIPEAVFQRLLSDTRFASHFAVGLGERLKASLAQSPVATFRPDLSLEVRQVVREPAVWVAADATVAEAARRMRDVRATCVLVRGDPPGIVTDRDFRNRVLAEGLGPTTPVSAIATRDPRMVKAGARIYEAWGILLEAGVHHLPVLREGEVTGVLTSTDLLRCSAQGPMAVLRRVERLSTRDGLAGYATTVTEMASALLRGGLDATAIAGFVARLNDVLVDRIVRMALADLGAAPAEWAWLSLGSEGRMEQTLLTDQDNALVYADRASDRTWFQRFAEQVNADLEAAGFPRCPGGYMARGWSGPISEWKERFAGWIQSPTPDALLQAAVFFDFRRVAGELDVELLDAVLQGAQRAPTFLRLLAREALEFKPPAALLLRLRGESSALDLKAQGIAPVVFLARCYGLELGGAMRSTVARLDAAVQAGKLAEETFANATEAYRFLVGLRLRLQLRSIAAGQPAAGTVALAELDAIERTRVKDSLRAVKALQDAGAAHFRTEF